MVRPKSNQRASSSQLQCQSLANSAKAGSEECALWLYMPSLTRRHPCRQRPAQRRRQFAKHVLVLPYLQAELMVLVLHVLYLLKEGGVKRIQLILQVTVLGLQLGLLLLESPHLIGSGACGEVTEIRASISNSPPYFS